MSNNALLPLIGCALVLSAVGVDYGLGQLDVPKPHFLPVESFPAVIGDWKGGPVQQVNPDIQKRLPTAKIVERVYTNPTGQGGGPDAADGHRGRGHAQPQSLLPLAGLDPQRRPGHAGRRPADDPDDRRHGRAGAAGRAVLADRVLPAPPPRTALLQKASVWRKHFMGDHSNMSLFVRITTPDTPLNRRALESPSRPRSTTPWTPWSRPGAGLPPRAAASYRLITPYTQLSVLDFSHTVDSASSQRYHHYVSPPRPAPEE